MRNIKIGDQTFTGIDTIKVRDADQEGEKVSFTLPTPLQEKTTTPTKATQAITPDSGYALSKVTVNAIPSNYIKPTGTKEITTNGTVDVTQFASARILVNASPITEVSTTEEMTALLVEANYGKVYKFVGTTNSTYTNGDLYEVVIE